MPDQSPPDPCEADIPHSDDRLWRTAVHEAGHAVAAVALGVGLQGVELFKGGKEIGGGWVRYGQVLGPAGMGFEQLVAASTNDQRASLAVVAIAGDAAELEVLGDLPRAHLRDELDAEHCLQSMTTYLDGEVDLDPTRRVAAELLSNRREQVIAVATTLINSPSHRLSGDQVIGIVNATPASQ